MKYSIDEKQNIVSRQLFVMALSLAKREKVKYVLKIGHDITTLYFYNDDIASIIYSLAIKAKLKENTYAKGIFYLNKKTYYEFFLSKKLTKKLMRRYIPLKIDQDNNKTLDLYFYDVLYLMMELYKE